MVVCVRIWSDMIEYVILYGRICWKMVKYDRVSDLISDLVVYVRIWSDKIEYVILYVIVSLLFRGSAVQSSRGSKFSSVSKVSKFPKFRWLNAE
jgi:hypothetical protein